MFRTTNIWHKELKLICIDMYLSDVLGWYVHQFLSYAEIYMEISPVSPFSPLECICFVFPEKVQCYPPRPRYGPPHEELF